MITCDECRPMLSRLMDRELASELAKEVELHTISCPSCAAYAREIDALDEALENLPEPDLPLTMQVALRNLERRRASSWWGDLGKAASWVAIGGVVVLVGEASQGTVELLIRLGIAIGSYVILLSRTIRPLTMRPG